MEEAKLALEWMRATDAKKSWVEPLNGWRRHFKEAKEPHVSEMRKEVRRHLTEGKRQAEMFASALIGRKSRQFRSVANRGGFSKHFEPANHRLAGGVAKGSIDVGYCKFQVEIRCEGKVFGRPRSAVAMWPVGTPSDHRAQARSIQSAQARPRANQGDRDLPRLKALQPGIKTPVLVLASRDDPIVPPSNGELLAKHLPNCRHELLEGGHLIWEDAADTYAAQLADWLRGGYRSV
jgi:pimeloyl-ACP methyl ester carboxylesterase